jgi:hypothetical protein
MYHALLPDHPPLDPRDQDPMGDTDALVYPNSPRVPGPADGYANADGASIVIGSGLTIVSIQSNPPPPPLALMVTTPVPGNAPVLEIVIPVPATI